MSLQVNFLKMLHLWKFWQNVCQISLSKTVFTVYNSEFRDTILFALNQPEKESCLFMYLLLFFSSKQFKQTAIFSKAFKPIIFLCEMWLLQVVNCRYYKLENWSWIQPQSCAKRIDFAYFAILENSAVTKEQVKDNF